MEYWWIGAMGVGFVALGVVFLVRGVRELRTRTPRGWLPTTGTIVDWKREELGVRTDRDAGRAFFPVIEYALPDGTLHTFTSDTAMNWGHYPRGKAADLLVDPSDPRRARLRSATTTRRLLGGIFVVVGLGAVVAGLVSVGVFVVILRVAS